jgi:hypothetical protein
VNRFSVLTISRLCLITPCFGVAFDVPPDDQGRKSSRRFLTPQYSPVANPQKILLRVFAASVPRMSERKLRERFIDGEAVLATRRRERRR